MRINLTHIALHVQDVEACCRFYERFCKMHVIHQREAHGKRLVWLAEPGREKDLIIVLLPNGPQRPVLERDFSHLGFAMESKGEVDRIAEEAREAGCLEWEPVQEPYPVGYYCGLKDPNGTFVEFSYGQPLGPGAPEYVD